MLIALLILWSLWGFLRHTINIMLEAVPEDTSFMEVKKALKQMEHIDQVHDLHIWTITSGVSVLSSHIMLSSCCCNAGHWHERLERAQKMLEERFGITHAMLQVEPSPNTCETECQLVEEKSPYRKRGGRSIRCTYATIRFDKNEGRQMGKISSVMEISPIRVRLALRWLHSSR